MYVVVVVVPVQRRQHLVLQLDGQDLLLITNLEGNGAMKNVILVGTRLRWAQAVVSAAQLGDYHCRVMLGVGCPTRGPCKLDAVAIDIPSWDIPPGWVTLRCLCPPECEGCWEAGTGGERGPS